MTETTNGNKDDLQIIKLSASSVKTYNQCNLRYYYNYIAKIPRQEWDHLLLGNLCHRALELFHREYLENGLNGNSLNKLMTKSFSLAKKEFIGIAEASIVEAKSLLGDYLKNVIKNGMPLVKGIETSFDFALTDDIIIRGFLDRLDILKDGTFHIVDYKTTKNVKYLEPFQLLMYGLWLKHEYPEIQKFKASYVLLRHGSKTKEYDFNLEDLKKVEKDLINYAMKIRQEDKWAPEPSVLCKWCDFVKICPSQKGW